MPSKNTGKYIFLGYWAVVILVVAVSLAVRYFRHH
jgi:hypothetical protein